MIVNYIKVVKILLNGMKIKKLNNLLLNLLLSILVRNWFENIENT